MKREKEELKTKEKKSEGGVGSIITRVHEKVLEMGGRWEEGTERVRG